MATEAQLREVKEKVLELVNGKYGGDWDAMFRAYAGKGGIGTLVDKTELMTMLEDAGIGSWLTRGKWADGILSEVDTSGDKAISEAELRAALQSAQAHGT